MLWRSHSRLRCQSRKRSPTNNWPNQSLCILSPTTGTIHPADLMDDPGLGVNLQVLMELGSPRLLDKGTSILANSTLSWSSCHLWHLSWYQLSAFCISVMTSAVSLLPVCHDIICLSSASQLCHDISWQPFANLAWHQLSVFCHFVHWSEHYL